MESKALALAKVAPKAEALDSNLSPYLTLFWTMVQFKVACLEFKALALAKAAPKFVFINYKTALKSISYIKWVFLGHFAVFWLVEKFPFTIQVINLKYLIDMNESESQTQKSIENR